MGARIRLAGRLSWAALRDGFTGWYPFHRVVSLLVGLLFLSAALLKAHALASSGRHLEGNNLITSLLVEFELALGLMLILDIAFALSWSVAVCSLSGMAVMSFLNWQDEFSQLANGCSVVRMLWRLQYSTMGLLSHRHHCSLYAGDRKPVSTANA
jgi:hypothetical protein